MRRVEMRVRMRVTLGMEMKVKMMMGCSGRRSVRRIEEEEGGRGMGVGIVFS